MLWNDEKEEIIDGKVNPEQDLYLKDISEDKKQKSHFSLGFGGFLVNCFTRLQNKQRLSMLSLCFVLFLCLRARERK